MPFHLWPVDDPAARALRVEGEPEHVQLAGIQRRRDQCGEKLAGRSIAQQMVPMPIQDDRRIRQMPIEDELQRAAHVSHFLSRHGPLAKDAGEPGGFEQAVLLSKGQFEHFAQREHRLTAGTGATRFNEADMPRREPRPAGQLELAQAARVPPRANPQPDGRRCLGHVGILSIAQ